MKADEKTFLVNPAASTKRTVRGAQQILLPRILTVRLKRKSGFVSKSRGGLFERAILILLMGTAGWITVNAQTNTFLDGIDRFIFQQMDVFDSDRPTNQPPLIQTYAGYAPSDVTNYHQGHIYDQSVAICYLLARHHVGRACQLADAILFLQKHDLIPDGHLHEAYYPTNLLAPDGTNSSVQGSAISAGIVSWAGIALTRTFVATGDTNYFDGARLCANWIRDNLKHDDGPGGFSWGVPNSQTNQVPWRSTEHNIDVFVLAMNLYGLTSDTNWLNMAQHASNFVAAMYNPTYGHYWTGTGNDGVTINTNKIPADAQSWSALATIDTIDHATNGLAWLDSYLRDSCVVVTNYSGIKFSNEGWGIESLQTASAAMAFLLTGGLTNAQLLLTNLTLIQQHATNSDGSGIVATPCTNSHSGYDPISNRLYVAASAWAGLAMLVAEGDSTANPMAPIRGFPVSITRSGDATSLWWPAVPGRSYNILWTTNVALGMSNWNVVSVGQTNWWADTDSSDSPKKFYRIRRQ